MRRNCQAGALYEAAKTGEGQVVLIEGEAGIGKTRLVDEFIGLLEQEEGAVSSSAPTAGWNRHRDRRVHHGLRGTVREGGSRHHARALSLSHAARPAFAALLRGDAPPPDCALTKDSPPNGLRPRYPRLAAERPTVVVIDDHFAPDEGRALFLALALAAPGHRMFVVGTARPGLPEAWTASVTRNDHASRFDLPRLGAKDLDLLLADVFRSERLAEELALQIATKSDGNPFFVIEIVRELRAGEFVTQGADGTWVRTTTSGRSRSLLGDGPAHASPSSRRKTASSSTWPRAGVRVRSDLWWPQRSGWRCCRRGASGGSRRRSGLCVRWGGATCLTTTR